MKRTIAALAFLATLSAAQAQERKFTLTIPEAQLQYLGKLLGKQLIEDTTAFALVQSIQAQVNAQNVREAQAARDAERERIKAELAKEDKQP